MKTISLRCNNCGSHLDVNPHAKYCTCSYCGSSLQIQDTGTTYYAEVVDQVHANSEAILANSEQLLIEKRIYRLDREWEIKRKKFEIRGRNGKVSMPSQGASLWATFVMAILVVAFFGLLGSDAPSELLWLGVPVVGIVIWTVVSSYIQLGNYEDAKRQYRMKRQRLLNELQNYYPSSL